jgi:hypothetical protein
MQINNLSYYGIAVNEPNVGIFSATTFSFFNLFISSYVYSYSCMHVGC